MRSDLIKSGFDKAPHRSLLKATGVIKNDKDFAKPFIGVCNSYIDLIPGHVHLQEFGKSFERAVMARELGLPTEQIFRDNDNQIVYCYRELKNSLHPDKSP